MSSDLTRANTTPFEDILDDLEQLTRTYLLVYRIEVGALFLKHFWDDDPHNFSDKNPHRTQRFELFFAKHGETLTRYGLSRRMARDSIRACIVMRTLPAALRAQLFLSQVLVLATVHNGLGHRLVHSATSSTCTRASMKAANWRG